MWIVPTNIQKDARIQQRNQLICASYEKGWTIPAIAEMFNRDNSSISRIIKFGKNTKADEASV